MLSLRLAICIGLLVCAGQVVRAQIQNQVDQQNIDKAESFGVELVSMIDDLPTRWAALQRREIVNSYYLDQSKLYVTRIEEVWASDQNGQVVYTRFSSGDRKTNNGTFAEDSSPFDGDVQTWKSHQQMMQKVAGQKWATVAKLTNIGSSSTHPFNWAIGNLNSAKMGGMRETNYLSRMLWGPENRRGCFAAFPEKKKGELVSYWGTENAKNPPFASQIVFSKQGLPVDFLLLKFPLAASKESIAKKEFSKLEQTNIQWKTFPQVQRRGQPLSLPVRIEIQSVLNQREELECVNEIVWKFGNKEVPDSVFIDPTKGEIVEPDFDH